MMQTFNLEKGEISFEADRIKISDDAKKQRLVTLFNSCIWTLLGIISVLRYLKTGDEFLLWSGLLIGISHFVILFITILRSIQTEILFDEIKSINVKGRFGNRFLDIKLSNNRIRRVNKINDWIELEQFIQSMLETKVIYGR